MNVSVKKIAISAMVLAMAGCSSSAAKSAKLTDGTYTGKAAGMDGDITVTTVISEGKIASIDVDEKETAGVGEVAAPLIADAIVQYQTTGVDNVTGATITSGAVKRAVQDTIQQAGGDSDTMSEKPSYETKDETIEKDVVIVGAGIAGLTAAVKAQMDGASVAIVEKQGFVGGTSVFSSGNLIATDKDEEEAALAETWNARNKLQERNKVDMDAVNAITANSAETLAMYDAAGIDYTLKDGMFRPTASGRAKVNAEEVKLATAKVKAKGGDNLIKQLQKYLEDNGVEIYLETTATELIQDGDQVTGVKATGRNGEKTFHAKSVILASGDYARNADLTAELAPDATENYPSTAVSDTGDGIEMAVKAGAVKADFGESMSGCFAPDPTDMPVVGQPNNSYPFESLLLTTEGKRVVAEDAGVHTQMVYFTKAGEPDAGWVIMDQETADKFLNLDKYLESTKNDHPFIKAYKESSVKALAKDMDVDASVLQASIDQYNAMCAAGEDTDFGKDAKYLSAIDDGTYYAVKEYDMTRGNYGGIETNANTEVIDKNGKAIPGLYAAGIISSAHVFGDYYPGREALALGAFNGFLSGQQAAANAAR
jgi:succinate dehydrogenase/fumarate reductase flavoprotein subunit/uncharacterized protein with FMN-binding domain